MKFNSKTEAGNILLYMNSETLFFKCSALGLLQEWKLFFNAKYKLPRRTTVVAAL